MRLHPGVRAVARAAGAGFVGSWLVLLALLATSAGAAAQADSDDDVAPTDEAPRDILHAPPPEPEERPVSAPTRVKEAPRAAPTKPPAAAPKPAPPKPAPTPKAKPMPVPSAPASAAAAAVASPPMAAPAAAVAVVPAVMAEDGTPPPPAESGDFAGKGAEPATTPQDDFEPDAQEYRKPKFKREYSIRIDPLNWLLLGRLAVELEVSLFEYLTVQLTPIFVTAESPIAVNYAGLDDPLKQHSNGLGPISGVSVGVGAWFWARPFHGYVLRLEFSNYGYNYRTTDAMGTIDRVDFTERRLSLFIGSHSRFGPFTFAGGFGLGYELNQQERCGLSVSGSGVSARETDCNGHQWIALDRSSQERADLNGPLHPVYFQARFTLGVVF